MLVLVLVLVLVQADVGIGTNARKACLAAMRAVLALSCEAAAAAGPSTSPLRPLFVSAECHIQNFRPGAGKLISNKRTERVPG